MDFRHPLSLISHPLDSDVLAVLAVADKAFTGREVQRAAGASHDGVRLALQRLASQGIVHSEHAGRAIMYRLNREHLAAPHIEAIAALRLELIHHLRDQLRTWKIRPIVAALFGSVARGDASEESDIDIFLVRPASVDVDDRVWRDQIDELEELVTRWTGNDTRTLEYGEKELAERTADRLVRDVLHDGIELAGTLNSLRKARPSRRQIHVSPSPNGGWRVNKDGTQTRGRVYGSKADAVRAGRKLAQSGAPTELVIHGRDGKVQERNNYSANPRRAIAR